MLISLCILGMSTRKERTEKGFMTPTDFSTLDRLLTNAEKNQLTSVEKSTYNTK